MSTKLADTFEAAVNALITSSKAQADADKDAGSVATRRKWALMGLTTGLFDFDSIRALFDRTELEASYREIYTDREKSKAELIVVTKLQSDVLSAFERDFKHRHRTPVRSRIHGAAIRQVAGDDRGMVNNMKRYATLLAAAADTSTLPDNKVSRTV